METQSDQRESVNLSVKTMKSNVNIAHACDVMNGKAEFSSLSPTLIVLWSSIDHRPLIIESNLVGNFYFWFKYSIPYGLDLIL